jgi:tetratricopeptide (TPR) repeat protein
MTPVARTAARSDREFVCVDAWIDEGQSYLRGARYEEAIESAQKARAALERLGDGGAVSSRAARLEILSGSAEVALGRGSDAEASFTRALEADPSLRLDSASVSPKVVRAFEETRKSIAPPATVAGAPPRPQFGDDVASDGSTTARRVGD